MTTKYVTVSGAGTKSGADWDNAYGLSEWVTHMTNTASYGDIYYVAGGTYTLTASLDANRSGMSGNGINVIGVNSGTTNMPPTQDDYAVGDDRPLIEVSTYTFGFAMYWSWRGFRFTLNNTEGITPSCSPIFVNCKISNSGASCYGVTINYGVSTTHYFFDTEITCPNGGGIYAGDKTIISNCYLHDFANEAVNSAMDSISIIDSIIASCDSGVLFAAIGGNHIVGNTFYDCTTAIDGDVYGNSVIMNNAICNCTDGIKFSSVKNQAVIDYNNYYGNTTDVTNVTKGVHDLAVDPGFTDAANGNFSIDSKSGMINHGFKTRLGVGA